MILEKRNKSLQKDEKDTRTCQQEVQHRSTGKTRSDNLELVNYSRSQVSGLRAPSNMTTKVLSSPVVGSLSA